MDRGRALLCEEVAFNEALGGGGGADGDITRLWGRAFDRSDSIVERACT